MANQEHLDVLKQGVETWNLWRKKRSDIWPKHRGADLGYANLRNACLKRADLRETDLSQADCRGSSLEQADLANAYLIQADFRRANLSNARITKANLYQAHLEEADLWQATFIDAYLVKAYLMQSHLRGADLSGANLTGADLRGADLTGTNLEGADISEVVLWGTHLVDVDLRHVQGLATVEHQGPSNISIDTIYRSQGEIPEIFLKKAGVPESFVEYMRSLVFKPIEYYSCFISFSSRDEVFAMRLYESLQSQNVRCWFAPHDMKIGDKIRSRIDECIRFYDKLLLVLSEHSMVVPKVKTVCGRK